MGHSWKTLKFQHSETRVKGINQAPHPRCATPHSAISRQGHFYLKHCRTAPAALLSSQNQHFHPHSHFLLMDPLSPLTFRQKRLCKNHIKPGLTTRDFGVTHPSQALLPFSLVLAWGGDKRHQHFGPLQTWRVGQ